MRYFFKAAIPGTAPDEWDGFELSLVHEDEGGCEPLESTDYRALLTHYEVPGHEDDGLLWTIYGHKSGGGVDSFVDLPIKMAGGGTEDMERVLYRALEILDGLGVHFDKDGRGGDEIVENFRAHVDRLVQNIFHSNDEIAVAIAEQIREEEEHESANPDAPCPSCAGPGVELGALGRVMHYRCRDCGIGYYRHA